MARNKRRHGARPLAPSRKRAIEAFLKKTKHVSPRGCSDLKHRTQRVISRPWPRVIPIATGAFIMNGGDMDSIDECLRRDLRSVGLFI